MSAALPIKTVPGSLFCGKDESSIRPIPFSVSKKINQLYVGQPVLVLSKYTDENEKLTTLFLLHSDTSFSVSYLVDIADYVSVVIFDD
jgi:hypothetical protein